jgi:RimJ/RimL family protein N-acetyltransferase
MSQHLSTLRLILREWRDSDLEPFAALNADPEVMKHFPSILTPAQSAAGVARIRAHFAAHGYGLFAVEAPGVADFIGFIGLAKGDFELPGFGAGWVEIAWRLARPYWGHGYAIEGAQAVVDYAFRERKLYTLVAMTTPANRRSRKVMERLRMTRNPAHDFDHPKVPDDSSMKRHVLYRLSDHS